MIADALNILVSSPSEQLKDDLKRHQVSISQFGRHLQSIFGNSAIKAGADVAKMMTSVGVAFKDGILTTREYAEAMSQLKAAYKFAQASGESYDSMVREGSALNEQYASSLDQISRSHA
ncbi:MAG: hypothetical protein IT424_09410 [Pirellulales bacterium]|nr:hypothetical protein [Pirellulales bacterium]